MRQFVALMEKPDTDPCYVYVDEVHGPFATEDEAAKYIIAHGWPERFTTIMPLRMKDSADG